MDKKSKSIILGIATLLVLLCYSCTQSSVAHIYNSVSRDGWDRDSLLNYNIQIDSLSQECNIDIELTYNNNYPYSNLYLLVSVIDSVANIVSSDTLQLLLADEYGEWKGNGWGTTYQQREEYKRDFKFPSFGKYNITITQGMRGEPIKGIERVGVKVDKVEKER